MRLSELFLFIIILIVIAVIMIHTRYYIGSPSPHLSSSTSSTKESFISSLTNERIVNLIKSQNETIGKLYNIISQSKDAEKTLRLLDILHAKEKEIKELKDELSQQQHQIASLALLPQKGSAIPKDSSSISDRIQNRFIKESDQENHCEERYGIPLIEKWVKSEEIWCAEQSPTKFPSELKCYPYHQEHKKLDGRGPDLFCEATNFFIDFSKVIYFLLILLI
jgi:hypothetical protein